VTTSGDVCAARGTQARDHNALSGQGVEGRLPGQQPGGTNPARQLQPGV